MKCLEKCLLLFSLLFSFSVGAQELVAQNSDESLIKKKTLSSQAVQSRSIQSLEGKQNLDLLPDLKEENFSYSIRQENSWSGSEIKSPFAARSHNLSLSLAYKSEGKLTYKYYHPVIVSKVVDSGISYYTDDPFVELIPNDDIFKNFNITYRHYLPFNIASREGGYRGHSRLYLHYKIPNSFAFLRFSFQYRKYWSDYEDASGNINQHYRHLYYLTFSKDIVKGLSFTQLVGLYDKWKNDGSKYETEIYLFTELNKKINDNWSIELAAESSVSRKESNVVYPANDSTIYYLNFVYSK